MMFTGWVTGISRERWAEESFDMGLFTYKTTIEGAIGEEEQQFIVINYFLDR